MAPADKNKGSSDIGNVSQVVPTIHPHVPIGDGIHIHSCGICPGHHFEQGKDRQHSKARPALALTAVDLACHPEHGTK